MEIYQSGSVCKTCQIEKPFVLAEGILSCIKCGNEFKTPAQKTFGFGMDVSEEPNEKDIRENRHIIFVYEETEDGFDSTCAYLEKYRSNKNVYGIPLRKSYGREKTSFYFDDFMEKKIQASDNLNFFDYSDKNRYKMEYRTESSIKEIETKNDFDKYMKNKGDVFLIEYFVNEHIKNIVDPHFEKINKLNETKQIYVSEGLGNNISYLEKNAVNTFLYIKNKIDSDFKTF